MPFQIKPESDDPFEYLNRLFQRHCEVVTREKPIADKFQEEFVGALSFTRCSDPRNYVGLSFGLPVGIGRAYRKPGGVLTNADAGFQHTFYRHKLDALDKFRDITFLTQIHCVELGKGGCAYYAEKPELALIDARAFTDDCRTFFDRHAPGRFFPYVINHETSTGRVYIDDPLRDRWVGLADLVAENGTSYVGDVFPHLPVAGRERLAVLARRHRDFLNSDRVKEVNHDNLSCIVVSGWAEFALGSPFIFPNDPRCNELEPTMRLVSNLTLRNVKRGWVDPFKRVLLMTAIPFHDDHEFSKSKTAATLQSIRMIERQKRHIEAMVYKEDRPVFEYIATVVNMDKLELVRL